MRSLISLLVVVLIVYVLSKLMLSNAPVHRSGSDESAVKRTSEEVRNRVNEATDSYQQSLEKSMQDAGASNH